MVPKMDTYQCQKRPTGVTGVKCSYTANRVQNIYQCRKRPTGVAGVKSSSWHWRAELLSTWRPTFDLGWDPFNLAGERLTSPPGGGTRYMSFFVVFFKKSPLGPRGTRGPEAGCVETGGKSSFFRARTLIFKAPGGRDGPGPKGRPEGRSKETPLLQCRVEAFRHGQGPRS